MYSPRIREDLIPHLYRKAKEKGKPMTKLVNEVLETYLKERSDNAGSQN